MAYHGMALRDVAAVGSSERHACPHPGLLSLRGIVRLCAFSPAPHAADGTTRLGIFRTLTDNFKEPNKPLSFQKNLAFSIIAGGTGALIGTPADAALVRMQADTVLPPEQRRGYKNAGDALVKMFRQEGLRGFFAGAAPTVYRGLSVNIGMLTTYDPLKDYIKPLVNNNVWAVNILSAMGSGWCASTVSLPFDFVKTRLQKQRKGPDGQMPYKSFADCVIKVRRSRSGSSERARGTPASEQCKSLFSFSVTQPVSAHGSPCRAQVAKTEGPRAFYNGCVRTTASPTRLACRLGSQRRRAARVRVRSYVTYVVRISPHITLTWIFMEMFKGVKSLE
jgi:hypothetical protein